MTRLLAASIACLALATGAGASDYPHCEFGAADGAAQPPSEVQSALSRLARGAHNLPILFRRYCGIAGEADSAYLDHLIGGVGCAPASDLGKQVRTVLDMPLDNVRGMRDIIALEARFPDMKPEICATLDGAPLPPSATERSPESDAQYEAHADAMGALEYVIAKYRLLAKGEGAGQ